MYSQLSKSKLAKQSEAKRITSGHRKIYKHFVVMKAFKRHLLFNNHLSPIVSYYTKLEAGLRSMGAVSRVYNTWMKILTCNIVLTDSVMFLDP